DGDGDLDLLTGSADGGAFLSENIGTRTEPQWRDFKSLIPASRSGTQSVSGGPMVPGTSTRLWVVDWNQDGKLDILLGDSVTLSDRKEGLTDSEYESLKASYVQRVQEAQTTYTEESQAFFDAQAAGEPSDELKEALEAAQLDFSAVFQSKSDFITERRTGHVWLFLQTD
ncbi:MAG: VCBS repeat-containing protein, partial [Pseudomonadota bacterium]